MKLSPFHPIVKLAYLFTPYTDCPGYNCYASPKQVSLCVLFWRCVWNLLVCTALASAALFLLYLTAKNWRDTLTTIRISVEVFAGIALIVGGGGFVYDVVTQSENVMIAWARAKKKKVCPIIEFDNGDEAEEEEEELEPIDAIIEALDRKD